MRRRGRIGLLICLLLACGGLWGCRSGPDVEPLPEQAREAVVLVHGMGRTPLSMAALEHDFEAAGYRVLNWGYSSWCCTVAELAGRLRADLDTWRGDADRIHFVGHSLGNIIVRQLLAEDNELPAGRVVMLAPPNQGSADADRYTRWLGNLLKPLPELRTDSTGSVRRIPLRSDIEVGIIAGDRDGKVTVAETRLEGARAHVVVPAAHSFIMLRQDVRTLVLGFVRAGRFAPEPPGARRRGD
ncbi:MAG TPA: alpha/beta hydrolase family protein [Longimicrobiales bacterium]|nr:alpha/beta hydrolase family protein [Longimicrobiales bacterium]